MRHISDSFFSYINAKFSHRATILLKSWINLRKSIISNRIKINFLRRCIAHKIFPPHIDRLLSKFRFSYNNHRSFFQYKNISLNFYNRLIRIELRDIYFLVRTNYEKMFHLSVEIYGSLPVSVYNNFFTSQSRSLFCFYQRENNRLNRKFNFLLSKQRSMSGTKPVHYYCYNCPSVTNIGVSSQRLSKWTFSNVPFNNVPSNKTIEVMIDPDTFQDSHSNLDSPREKWFVNLSKVDIPPEIRCFLQLGENFSLPHIDRCQLTMEFIKQIECNLMKLPPELRTPFRDQSKSIVKSVSSYAYPKNLQNDWLSQAYATTKNFLSINKDLILTRADKGNVTIALDKPDYLNKVENLLRDENTYVVIKKDPTRKLISDLRVLLSKWKNQGYISNAKYRSLLFTDGTLPRAYGLPKIHKTGIPFRLIVSSVNSPLYSLALFLHKIMTKNFPAAPSHINNSFDLVHNLSNIFIDNDTKLISLDVISLFTNIPVDLALTSVSNRWCFIHDIGGLPECEFLNAVSLVLNSTFFTFNNTIYRQTFGTPMGSPLSPIIADLVLQDIEKKALNTLRFTPRFYFRYVDDILMTAPSDSVDLTLSIFNSFHDRLQFTSELEVDRKINFLDVTLMVENNVLIFDWFHKSTFSGRYLNFYSQHPDCQKKGTIIGLVDRAFSLSHPKFHNKNFECIVRILLDNCYPLDVILKVMNRRLKFLFNRRDRGVDEKMEDSSYSYFTIPFLPHVNDGFRGIIKNTNVKLSYFSLNKLNKFIKGHKDRIAKHYKTNVVYKINCSDCDASYVGQTSRMLKTRISEHKSQINKNYVNRSVVTNHRLQLDHDFRWDDAEILDETSFYNKRVISEMLYIKRQKNGLNLQTDTENLPSLYHDFINKLPKI